MDKGVYCLAFSGPGCTVRVGALGEIAFLGGWHIYVGSALGSGGLARLDRHIALAKYRDKRPKWHVDYLSRSGSFALRYTVHAVTPERLECPIARSLGAMGGDVPGFGSSDCGCPSHLFYRVQDPAEEIGLVFCSLGLAPVTTIIKNP
jgi:Uri superfamily endonuclease